MRFLACLLLAVLVLIGCWWDTACAFAPSTILVPPLSSSAPHHSYDYYHYYYYRYNSHSSSSWRHVVRQPSTSTTMLYALPHDLTTSKNTTTTTTDKDTDDLMTSSSSLLPKKESSSEVMVDVPIVMSDLLAIAVAMQLLGLTNVLNDPTFWNQGGWLQPITSTGISNTLPVVVQRFCLVALSWLFSAFVGKGLTLESSSSSSSRPTEANTAAATNLGKLLVPFFIVLLLLEGMVTIISAAITTTLTSSGEGGLELVMTQAFVFQTFQLWYFSVLAILAGRYIVSRLPIY
jgi:hypothetical protein